MLGMDSGDLSHSVAEAVLHMNLTDADKAAVDLALTYAEAIDKARASDASRQAALDAAIQDADPDRIKLYTDRSDLTKALYLGPHLLKCLSELGGTPAGRKAMAAPSAAVGSKLDELRARRDAAAG